jgi:hypothetical protein
MSMSKIVIASGAKQSIESDKAGLLRRFTPRNDEKRVAAKELN